MNTLKFSAVAVVLTSPASGVAMVQAQTTGGPTEKYYGARTSWNIRDCAA
ncbi:hypothetical protein [Paraburkholderia domus]|nr:hypothetical protein [Paraburkholderia domus]MBK5052325.1 hypothetical protein [Burkholderia sp. R-70006]MBK5182160.1 hypothetical protein [Burkholderia sp. R-69749]CAE6806972.1 hypothetical protein R70006_05575 [Paraburkholderia domus]CAE6842141.1 hypothetical protein R69749_04506 [Paraburkholderia domus]